MAPAYDEVIFEFAFMKQATTVRAAIIDGIQLDAVADEQDWGARCVHTNKDAFTEFVLIQHRRPLSGSAVEGGLVHTHSSAEGEVSA